MYTGDLLDLFRSPKHVSHPFSRYACSGAQKKAEHHATCKHRRGHLQILMQRRRSPSNDTGIIDWDGLRLDCRLLEFLQDAVVQVSVGICRTLEVVHSYLSLTACPCFPD